MPRRRGDNYNVIAGTGIIIAFFYYIYQYHTTLNIDFTVPQILFTVLPALIVTAICIYVTVETKGVGRLGGCIATGAALCYLLYGLDAEGLVTVDMFWGLTIAQTQTWIIVLSTIFGAVLYGTN